MSGRLPDFVLIGAMKAGTTTLFRRLGQLEAMSLPDTKEPHFFSNERQWAKGEQWYASLFEGREGVTGEASTGYSDPADVRATAARMSRLIPQARLLYALRHPADRMRSHYVHQVLRAREHRPFAIAIRDAGNEYVRRSLYGRVVAAYVDFFPMEQLHVYRLEELDVPGSPVWDGILDHLGVPYIPMPLVSLNVSDDKVQFTRPLRLLWDMGLTPERGIPRPLRKLGKRLLTRDSGRQSSLIDTARSSLPAEVTAILREDQELLRTSGVFELDPQEDLYSLK